MKTHLFVLVIEPVASLTTGFSRLPYSFVATSVTNIEALSIFILIVLVATQEDICERGLAHAGRAQDYNARARPPVRIKSFDERSFSLCAV